MIDNILYAKLAPHLKRSITLKYLESGTYEWIAAHLEREIKMKGLENDGQKLIPAMTAEFPNGNSHLKEWSKIACLFLKKHGHFIRDCRNRMKKEQTHRNDPSLQNVEALTSKILAPCPYCRRTSHPPGKCWTGPNAANRLKTFKQNPPTKKGKRQEGQFRAIIPTQELPSTLKTPWTRNTTFPLRRIYFS